MTGGSRKRHGLPEGPSISKPHKSTGIIVPRSKELVPGIDLRDLKPIPRRGGVEDSERVRLVRRFYSDLPESLSIYQEIVVEVPFRFTLNERFNIVVQTVPSDRTFVVDNVLFFATPLFGTGILPAGEVEGAVQAFFQIGNTVPLEIRSTRVQPGLPQENRAYFPFFNDRVGARQVNFSLFAKRGRDLIAYYINRSFSPVPLRSVGVRIEGWMVDSNALEEIMEQQT